MAATVGYGFMFINISDFSALKHTQPIFSEDSDEEDDQPSRKRRLAERAVEGEAADDEEV